MYHMCSIGCVNVNQINVIFNVTIPCPNIPVSQMFHNRSTCILGDHNQFVLTQFVKKTFPFEHLYDS